MAFNDKSGGPWGSGSGSKNGGSGNNNNPWGGGSNQNNNPDFDEIINSLRKRFGKFYPSGSSGNRFILLIVFIIFVIWLLSGFYSVGTQEQGIVLRFGDYSRTTQPGLHYHLPSPIERVLLPRVTSVNRIDIGFRALDGNSNARRDVSSESKMITGDENIVDIDFRVMWKISMAENFLFNLQDPEETVKVAAESVMRGIIGQIKIESALTDAKELIQSQAKSKLQELVDEYGAGIEIRDVQLLSVNPPSEEVIDAFNDVQRARQERDKLINEAEAFFNDVVPRARGESAQLVAQAEAYSEEIVNRAKGDASRFNDIYKSYLSSKEVTVKRIYLETFEEILGNVNKIIIDTEVSQSGVLPFLPLPELNNRNRSISSGGN